VIFAHMHYKRLQSTDWTKFQAAAKALGRCGNTRAVEPLILALDNYDPKFRCVTLQALAEIGDKRAVEPILKLVVSTDAEVRLAAADALDKLGVPAWKTWIEANRDMYEQICAQGTEEERLELLNAFAHKDWNVLFEKTLTLPFFLGLQIVCRLTLAGWDPDDTYLPHWNNISKERNILTALARCAGGSLIDFLKRVAGGLVYSSQEFGEYVGTPLGHPNASEATISPNGKFVCTWGSTQGGGSHFHLWDIEAQRQVGGGVGGDTWCGSIVFTPNSRHVITLSHGSDAGFVGVLETASGQKTCGFRVSGRFPRIAAGDNSHFSVVGLDADPRIYSLSTGEDTGFSGTHSADVLAGCLSHDGRFFVSGASDGTVCLWDWRNSNHPILRANIKGKGVTKLQFSPDGKHLFAAAYGSPHVYLWEYDGNEYRQKEGTLDCRQSMCHACFSKDGRSLLVATEGTAILWDVSSLKIVNHIPMSGSPTGVYLPNDGAFAIIGMVGAYSGDDSIAWDTNSRFQTRISPKGQGARIRSAVDGIAISCKGGGVFDDTGIKPRLIDVGAVSLWNIPPAGEIGSLQRRFSLTEPSVRIDIGEGNSVEFVPTQILHNVHRELKNCANRTSR